MIRSTLIAALVIAPAAWAQPIDVLNASFEEGTAGWTLPSAEIGLVSTIDPRFDSLPPAYAPHGRLVARLFGVKPGAGEFGLSQIVKEKLEGNTTYVLTVAIGNHGQMRPEFLSASRRTPPHRFSGYRVELRAGGVLLAKDENSIDIPFGKFASTAVRVKIESRHAKLGERLEIRLINLNRDTWRDSISFDKIELAKAKPE